MLHSGVQNRSLQQIFMLRNDVTVNRLRQAIDSRRDRSVGRTHNYKLNDLLILYNYYFRWSKPSRFYDLLFTSKAKLSKQNFKLQHNLVLIISSVLKHS